MSSATPSVEKLYALYLQFNRDFLEKNSEAEAVRRFGINPSLEVFEHALKNLDNHPEQKIELVRQLIQGWQACQQEQEDAIKDLYKDFPNEDWKTAFARYEPFLEKTLYPWYLLRLSFR